ncbi:MAG TPA: nitroreductase/quinone reductase family protein [Nocardioidaceae bacterium]|nr:nitroreductase/quinone reductase family protein [Nocardioidaceae bacterium]
MPGMGSAFVTALRVHQEIYVRSHGVVGHRLLLGMRTLVLHTTGAKSGVRRSNALVYAPDKGRYLVVPSNGGANRHPGWFHNLRKEPEVDVWIGVQRKRARASWVMPGEPDFERLWKLCNIANRGQFDQYRTKTARPIPVVVLTPL